MVSSAGWHMNEARPHGPPCVVILGMHRSGTSLLAGSLEAAGLNLGEVKKASPYNRMGNKENASIRSLNNALHKKSGAAWRRPPAGQIRWHPDDEERGEVARRALPPCRASGELPDVRRATAEIRFSVQPIPVASIRQIIGCRRNSDEL